jgi:TRAP-type mannitol/chloroaromatic compound transport system substrate-binding protein
MIVEPFAPDINRCYKVNVAVAATSYDQTVASSGDRLPMTVRIVNGITASINVIWGTVTQTATTANGMTMLASSVETFTLPAGTTHIAVLSATGTGTVEITCGQGS